FVVDVDGLRGGAGRELEVEVGLLADGENDALALLRIEAAGGGAGRVGGGANTGEDEGAALIGGEGGSDAGAFVGQCDLGAGDDAGAGVGDRSGELRGVAGLGRGRRRCEKSYKSCCCEACCECCDYEGKPCGERSANRRRATATAEIRVHTHPTFSLDLRRGPRLRLSATSRR